MQTFISLQQSNQLQKSSECAHNAVHSPTSINRSDSVSPLKSTHNISNTVLASLVASAVSTPAPTQHLTATLKSIQVALTTSKVDSRHTPTDAMIVTPPPMYVNNYCEPTEKKTSVLGKRGSSESYVLSPNSKRFESNEVLKYKVIPLKLASPPDETYISNNNIHMNSLKTPSPPKQEHTPPHRNNSVETIKLIPIIPITACTNLHAQSILVATPSPATQKQHDTPVMTDVMKTQLASVFPANSSIISQATILNIASNGNTINKSAEHNSYINTLHLSMLTGNLDSSLVILSSLLQNGVKPAIIAQELVTFSSLYIGKLIYNTVYI